MKEEKIIKKEMWENYTNKSDLMRLLGENNEKNLLCWMVKELVDNAIDANRKAQANIKKEKYRPCELGLTETKKGFYIIDHGNGLSEKDVRTIFSLKRDSSYSSKYIKTVTHGMLGQGIRVVLGICCIYGGKIKLFSQGKKYLIIPNQNSGEVEITSEKGDVIEGTKIEVEFDNEEFNDSFLSWGQDSIKLDKTLFFNGYTNPWWYSAEEIKFLLKKSTEEKFVRKFSKKFFNIKIQKESKFYKLKINDLLSKNYNTVEEFLNELRETSTQTVKFNRIGHLEGYEYYKFEYNYEELFNRKIPYLTEVWAKKSSPTSILNTKYYKIVFKLFINGSRCGEENKLMVSENEFKEEKERIISINPLIEIKIPRCNVEFLLNITTPWIQTEGEGKKPKFSDKMENIIKTLLTEIVQNINKELKKSENKKPKYSEKNDRHKLTKLIGQEPINQADKNVEELEQKIKNLNLKMANDNHALYKAMGQSGRLKAAWFYYWWNILGKPKNIHLRRIHYLLVSKISKNKDENKEGYEIKYVLDGKEREYKNDMASWKYLVEASTFARNLRLVDPGDIVDRRNPQIKDNLIYPINTIDIIEGDFPLANFLNPNNIDNMKLKFPEPEVKFDYSGLLQPNIVVVVVEKTTINDIIEPLQEKYQFIFQPAQGFLSYTTTHQILSFIKRYEKPMIILYISDFDPSGISMPSALAQQVEIELIQQGLIDRMKDLRIVHVALTREQIDKYKLPSVPDVEKRGYEKFKKKYGNPVELDALVAHCPGELEKILKEELAKYMDISLPEKIEKQKNDFSQNIEKFIQENQELNSIKKEVEKISEGLKEQLNEFIKNNQSDLNELLNTLFKYKEKLSGYLKQFDPKIIEIEKTLEDKSLSFSSIILDIKEVFYKGIGYYLLNKTKQRRK